MTEQTQVRRWRLTRRPTRAEAVAGPLLAPDESVQVAEMAFIAERLTSLYAVLNDPLTKDGYARVRARTKIRALLSELGEDSS